jgi:hypothetical protein
MYHIKKENPFEGRLLVCNVPKRVEVHFEVNEMYERDFFKFL